MAVLRPFPRALLLALMLLSNGHEVVSLKLQELRIPSHVPLGTRAELYCSWKLNPTDVLYSVKWYKDGNEFFRHVPRSPEPLQKYPLPGVQVESSNRNASFVTLRPAVLETGGRYRCEVSGERPLFLTVTRFADMVIVVLPSHGPVITGARLRYRLGERVQVNCTSGASQPAAKLAWYINGEPAPHQILLPPTYEKLENGLEISSLALDFKAKPRHFRKGDLKLKCLATIASVYWRSNEESVQKDRSKGHVNSGASTANMISVTRNLGCSATISSHFLMFSITIVIHMWLSEAFI